MPSLCNAKRDPRHLLEEGMWSEEIELMQTALHVCEDKSGLEYAHLCNTYGHLEVERANASKGLEYLETSRKIRETLLDPMHPELANTYNNIGNAVLQEYETPEAVPRAIELYSRSVKINDAPSSAFIWHLNLSRATRLAGDYARARFHAAKSRECVDEMFEPDTHWDATTKVHLANILFDEGLIPEAEALWTSAFKAFQKTSETRAATVAVQLKLAHVTMLKGDHKQAVYVPVPVPPPPFPLFLQLPPQLNSHTKTASCSSASSQSPNFASPYSATTARSPG
ncbi:hypothetical protein EJ05DRAFT_315515 [Pseudovirgaria hyperparasitica]|uniref:TPR-like protein n=1 Tax=Pseudovirgaria hyperparasitica TaxID=470096 RepID=A0A6A6WBI9_9PEZI|nr:uncharacterized protein EJ05DRAFT_315515 [Pseudovirgaria hyperparasitica]KAF2759935.1 hypothetical protein EJ05DRAFT_315515 [Pseudovirgaria hyperparasitica]